MIGYRMMHLKMYPEHIYGEEGDRRVTVVFSPQIVLTRRARKHLRNTATSTCDVCKILLKAQIKLKSYYFSLIHGSSTSQVHFFTQTNTRARSEPVNVHYYECTHFYGRLS